jgi:hypothetical protein
MSTTDAALLARIDALLEKAKRVRATMHGEEHEQWVDAGPFQEWRSQAQNAIASIVGKDHVYATDFADKVVYNDALRVDIGTGYLRALREDIANGYLRRLESIVSAEVFTDFLDMAQHLLDAGFKDPAASLTGAVLEDGLRRIATAKAITFNKRDGLAKLNEKCAQAAVYNALMKKQIDVWTEIRNKADHGHFTEYAAADVASMVSGVSSFLATHL